MCRIAMHCIIDVVILYVVVDDNICIVVVSYSYISGVVANIINVIVAWRCIC